MEEIQQLQNEIVDAKRRFDKKLHKIECDYATVEVTNLIEMAIKLFNLLESKETDMLEYILDCKNNYTKSTEKMIDRIDSIMRNFPDSL